MTASSQDAGKSSSACNSLLNNARGAVESPQVFASAMDWILADVIEAAFVDDCILWNGHKATLESRVSQLISELPAHLPPTQVQCR